MEGKNSSRIHPTFYGLKGIKKIHHDYLDFLFSMFFLQKQKHLINIICNHRKSWNNMGRDLLYKFTL